MPVWGRILVQLPSWPDAYDLNRWRRDILIAFDPDDFTPDGPLRQVPWRDLDLVPFRDGSGWLELGLRLNYYGEGYERGGPARFVEYAEWLEQHLPDSRIYYGHDNSDEQIEPFDRLQRIALLDYYARVGHEPYDRLRLARVEEAEVKGSGPGTPKHTGVLSVVPGASPVLPAIPGASPLDGYLTYQATACAQILPELTIRGLSDQHRETDP